MIKPELTERTFTAVASPNIALIKYWGNRDHAARLPSNGSISITLGDLLTRTSISLNSDLKIDQLYINDTPASKPALLRAAGFLDGIRHRAQHECYAEVRSTNSYPMGAGIASSAAAYAALATAAAAVYGLELDPIQMSRVARRGSGSAARSICSGFVELYSGATDEEAFAESLHPEDYWDIVDIIAVVDTTHKSVHSSQGHVLAETSPLQAARISDTPRRLMLCRDALARKDFVQLAQVTELDSNMMHAVMMTSSPPLLYWMPGTIAIMQAVQDWRDQGLEACYTIDAGPNVHVICNASNQAEVNQLVQSVEGVDATITSTPGPGARLVTD